MMRSLVLALCAGGSLVVPAAPALACHNAILLETSQVASRLRVAERQLEAGESVDAVRTLRFVSSVLRGRSWDYELDATPRQRTSLTQKLDRTVALAVVRRDGHVDRRRMRAARVDATARDENLRWAVERLDPGSDTDPVARARFAEALARVPARRAEASAILADLVARDLVPDAWRHRAVADLADRTGDAARRDEAIRRCERAAGTAARLVCPRLVVASR
jgi:hypothetical protein